MFLLFNLSARICLILSCPFEKTRQERNNCCCLSLVELGLTVRLFFDQKMVIIGPKIVPEEEPKSESKVFFSVRWMKEFSQIFNSSDRIDEGGAGTSENKMKKKKKKNGWNMVRIRRTKQFSSDPEQIRYESGCFEYKQIKAATENFSPANMIGRGGFGPVYKGVLPNKTAIAVKNLSSNSKQGKREYLNEINTISRLRHPNLVTLYGHCAVDNKFLLVYEYMENSCLATALSGSRPNLKERLDWQTRVKICIGIARGLAFLHEGAAFRIIHRDIKLSNVLLDKDLNPKIADFGLARLDLEEGTHISTCIAGTMGYMAPEYALRGRLTAKADIYSFGVVILELISGKRCSDKLGDDSPHLLDFAVALQKKGDLISLINENLRTGISVKEARVMLDLAMLCISYSPEMRPSMLEVVNILEGKTTMKAPTLIESDDLSRVDSDEMSMIEYSDNYIDNTTSEMVTHQGNASTNLESEALVLSKYRDLISNAKDSTSEEQQDGVGVLSSSRASPKQENNICTTVFCGDSISVANDPNNGGGKDAIQVFSSPGASNEEDKTYTSSRVNDSISEDRDDSRLLIDTNVSTAKTFISNAKASTSSTLEYVTEVGDKAELKYIEPHFEAGKYYIECSDEELKVGCNKWKNSLVGCFVSESGAFCFDKEVDEDVLRQAIEKASDVASEGNGYSVSFIGNGHFVLQFSSDEDKIRVLETSGLLHIEGETLIFRKWDWKLKFDKVEMLKSVLVWVKIYNLPLFLWNSSFLSKVGSALGIPICADQTTLKQQRLHYARIYIQVVSSKPLLDTLLISIKGMDYLLNLEYDWKPLRCTYCFTFGHIESKCTMKGKGKQVLE
ncbi:serine/threonine-protein kinase BLUS1-like [Papaver somniferum]|uniref:serine/threonine-protein kinase BLUS1-like n=1 Tax=Papaver somniferum TaxID=3469 RepID=UPI000E6F5403|nr:serine/threonine-protein kinase BLUS1-like [Papaver somniferum]XP_026441810.1 serine/threonine-protein kinase BLUS1-like [Papaver somniferum]XP_026441811.1 serine/threonine-protein kinase BLUS1-like [Papaver somniferum]XP_026441812.1 serine/threonine-protein kinase BLUS1-like [Papaver somniferum]XP_026441813.1 serine/threonine-protein kinase BLUS1-like [Papaver somniferum]XP_026441814.1 serine/threonine-protein kinase BLUS1-like [Papaver somniferum]